MQLGMGDRERNAHRRVFTFQAQVVKNLTPVFVNRRAAARYRYRALAARGSPDSCHFSFLSIFHEEIFYIGNILRRIIFVNVSKSSFH